MNKNVSIKDWTDWFFMSEKQNKEKFDDKHKKGLNIIRLILILMVGCIYSLKDKLLNSATFFKITDNWFCVVFILLLVYIIVIIYKAWIKKVWEFFKKDSIVHYIFLAIIPATILFFGYQYVHVGIRLSDPNQNGLVDKEKPNDSTQQSEGNKNNNPNKVKSEKTAGKNSIPQAKMMLKEKRAEYDEIVDRLNGFYSALFTAIAVIAAVLGFGAWKTIKELRDKLEKFKEVEEKVVFLHEKKDLAKWAQELFDKDSEKRIVSSTSLNLSEDDKKKLENVEYKILKDSTENSWFEIVYAKKIMDNAKELMDWIKRKSKTNKDEYSTKIEKKYKEIEKIYERVQKIYMFIENRDLWKDDSDVESILYHLEGQLFWFWYKLKKEVYIKELNEKNIVAWFRWWNEGKFKNEFLCIELIKKAKMYYKKSLKIIEEGDDNSDETLGNLAIVLIELSKFEWTKSDREVYLNQANQFLNEKVNKDFNTYWDRARVLYYLDPKINSEEINNLLRIKTIGEIENKRDKEFFIESLKNEITEIGFHFEIGFPGNENLIKELEEILSKKTLC